MKINPKISTLIKVVFMLSILWIIFFISDVFLSSQPTDNLKYLPSSAKSYVIFNSKTLISDLGESLILKNKDPKLIKQLLGELTNEKGNDKTKNLGINFLAKVNYITHSINGRELATLSFNLNSTSEWDKEEEAINNEPTNFAFRINNVGFLTFSTIQINEEEKQQIAESFSNDFHEINDELAPIYGMTSSLFLTHDKLTYSIVNTDNQINIEGNYSTRKKAVRQTYTLPINGFHFSSRIVPNWLNDSVQKLFSTPTTKIPKIEAFSINYYGLDIQKINGDIIPIPDMELILQFEEDFKAKRFINSIKLFDKLQLINSEAVDTFENKNFRIEQIDKRSIYVGRTNHTTFQAASNSLLLNIKGSPAPLTKLKGSTLLTSMLNMNRSFGQFRQFNQAINFVSIEVNDSSNESHQLNGSIQFKEDAIALHEIIKLMLQLN